MRLDALRERLRAHADVIAGLAAVAQGEQPRWKPDPSQWSILEVVNHLADEEVEDFRTRLDLTLNRTGEPWPPIDPPRWATERRYNERRLPESIDRFLERRAESVAWLGALSSPDWTLAYEHPRAGRITAGDLLLSWVAHDLIHIRQINRLHREFLAATLSEHSSEYAGRW